MATAILELFPETKLGHGPATDNGFFYDVYRETPFTEADLAAIEARMAEVVARDEPFVREDEPREKGLADYAAHGEFMKVHFIERFTKPGEEISLYRNGNFTDFCRGPHVPSTGRVKAFKVTSIAGAYWLGDEKNQQLQRIYGTAFFNAKDLDAHFKRLEEIKARDHRVLGKQLDLFSIQEVAGAGLIFWHPKGGLIRKTMEDWMRDECIRRGYKLVFTPHIMRRELWKISGHEGYYAENMYPPMELDDAEYRLKPMNCPGHILIYKNSPKSYRDLPAALRRTRQRLPLRALRHHARPAPRPRLHPGRRPHLLHARARSKTRSSPASTSPKPSSRPSASPSSRSSSPPGTPTRPTTTSARRADWDRADRLAQRRARPQAASPSRPSPAKPPSTAPRSTSSSSTSSAASGSSPPSSSTSTCPPASSSNTTAKTARSHQPVMVHRALFGSVERFFGVLIEHYAGAFPLWLAPVQVGLVPISARSTSTTPRQVKAKLEAAGLRVELDARNEKMNAKIRDFGLQKIPFILVIGDKESAHRLRQRPHPRQRRPGLHAPLRVPPQSTGDCRLKVHGPLVFHSTSIPTPSTLTPEVLPIMSNPTAEALASASPSVLRSGESITGAPLEFIGKSVWIKHSEENAPGSLCILEDSSPPHHGPPLHRHPFEEFWYILKGEFLFEVGGKRCTARPGDFVHAPANVPHAFQNALNEESKLLMIARPGGIHTYFEELAAEMVNDPEDIAALNAVGAKYGIEVVGPPLGAHGKTNL